MSHEMSSEEQSSLQITSSSSGVRALPVRASSRSSRGSRSSHSSSPSPTVRKGPHLKQSPTSDRGPGSGSLVPFAHQSPHNRQSPDAGAISRTGAAPSRNLPTGQGPQGFEGRDDSGVRLYQQNVQQNISVGLDPNEVIAQAREFEAAVYDQAQAAVQEAQGQVREEARQFGTQVVNQAQNAVFEAQAIAKAAAAAAVEQARSELRLEVQQRELAFQQKEADLIAQVRTLQNEITILRHQNMPPPADPQHNILNGAELASTIAELRAEVSTLRSSVASPQRPRIPLSSGVGILPPASSDLDLQRSPHRHQAGKRVDSNPSSSQHTPIPIAPSIRQIPSQQPSWHGSPVKHDPYSDDDSDDSELRLDFGGPPNPPDPSPHGSEKSHHSFNSRGVGSVSLFSEEGVYKHKDLSLVKIDTLPRDAAQFRSWKNAFVTKVCAIDRTGSDTLLKWLLPAFETSQDVDLSDPQGLPRFDAHLASLLADPKHLNNELGMQLQGYIEGCQLQYTAPRGRVLLQMVARRFFLDQRRGANLTEQALLELQLDTFTYQSLLAFANRVEYILNSIPVDHQPSEQTKFTWLFSRLKKCRLLQRHIDRIKDAHEGSRVRTWDWLFSKLKDLIAELREDANETAIKDALSPSSNKPNNPPKTKEQREKDRRNREKGAVADPQNSDSQSALPGKPKAAPKGPGKGKAQPGAKAPGKGSPKGDKPKGGKGTKGTPSPPPPKAPQQENPKDQPTTKEKAPCLFFPKGTCNRGPNCPFAHVGPGGKAPKAGAATKATVAATVAAVLPTSANGSSVGTSPHRHGSPRSSWYPFRSLFDRVLRWLMGLSIIATPATIPSVDIALPLAQSGPVHLEWIADSGAGRNLTSYKALAQQGIGSGAGITATQTDPVKFYTGNGTFTATEVVRTVGSRFGSSESYLMADCPVVRSMGELVNHHGHPFVWLPGSLPFFLPDSTSVSSDAYGNLQMCSTNAIYASRLDGHVPVFQETVEFAAHAAPASAHAGESPEAPSAAVDPKPPEVDPGEGHADSEREEEIPAAKTARLIKDAASCEHRFAHFPKNPACKICTQARMYARKVTKRRPDPLHDRGSLEPTTAFGERIAADVVVVFKESSKDDRETTLLVIRDEFSGFVRSFPLVRRTTENVVRALLQFAGKHAESKPVIMFKSDNARELESACQQMAWVPEPTLANRWPHNSVLERDIRSIQEITRAVHLQAGFAIRPGLWVHSAVFATFVLNLNHSIADRKESRYIAATGGEFPGRMLLLGQLVYYRTDPKHREKFEPSAAPALFCGYRFDSGPESFKGVYLVLDYRKVKAGTAGSDLAVSVPFEELYVPEGEEIFPMRAAFERALEGFTEPKFPDIKGLEVPFSPLSPDSTPAKRHEYITLDRIIKYGITPGCKACKGDAVIHSPVCKVRFDGLVRADKAAEARIKSLPPTPVSIPPTPLPPAPPSADPTADPAPDALDEGRDDDRGGLGAMVNKEIFVPDDEFLARDRQFRRSKAPGNNQLVEYCCSDDSEVGFTGDMYGVDCLSIGMSSIDFANPDHVDQAKGQIKQGATIWMSMLCLENAAQQHLHDRPSRKEQGRKAKAKARQMLKLAISLAEHKLSEGCHIAVDCPEGGWLWDEPDWIAFEKRVSLKRVILQGGSSESRLCISTTSLRALQLFGQQPFIENDPQIDQLIIEAFFPSRFYCRVPSMSLSHALVTRNLAKSEWLHDTRGLEAVQSEGLGLRANNTWNDQTVRPLHQLRRECRESGRRVQIAELLTLCGVKHYELQPSQHKYKGRIVFRGDQVRDASGNPVLFGSEDTATTPTGLVGLAACIFYGLRPGHATSVADAIQAYLQAKIGRETWVIIPRELWLPEWSERFSPDSRLVVKLEKSLYGHPESGKRWQDHLTAQLKRLGGREMPAYPSSWVFDIGSQKLVLNVYVDDLTLSGPVELHSQFWHKLRSLVKLEPEVFVQGGANGCRILGRHHSFTRDDSVATCEFDMIAYTQQHVDFMIACNLSISIVKPPV